MADNIAVTSGVGTSIATDDVGGVQYQRVKLDGGGDGLAVPIIAGHGLAAAALLVELPTDGTGNVANVGTIGTSVTPGGGAAHLGKAEDAAHTSGDTGVMALGVRNDTLAVLAAHDHDYAPLQVNATGALYVDLAGPSTGALDGHKIEDTAHASGDVGVMALTVRQDTAAALSGTDADYQPLITDATGRLHVNIGAPGVAATSLGKAEDAAHTSADVGVMVLAVRQDTLAALAGTTADYIPLSTDSLGRLNVTTYARDSAYTWAAAAYNSADATGKLAVAPAPGAGEYIYVKEMMVANTSVGTIVFTFEDETSATARLVFALPTLASVHLVFENAIKIGATDKKLVLDTDAAGQVYVTTWTRSGA